MLKGLLTALAVMLGCTVAPIAQLLLAPFGPFIGAYLGMRYVDTRGARSLAVAIRFGIWLGAVSAVILVVIALAMMLIFEMPGKYVALLWSGVVVFAVYVVGMGTLGALYRLMKAQAAVLAAAETE